MSNEDKIKVKPFLKWAGGKSQLISVIGEMLPKDIENSVIPNYVEPFVGGGALFFHLLSEYTVEKAYISDTNEDLILTYNVIKRNVESLIKKLADLESEFSDLDHESKKDIYYPIRVKFNKSKDKLNYKNYSKKHIQQAAYFIFLNKTCFNGLYRVNSKGHFNVPMGRYKKPLICDGENLMNISNKLNNNEITIKNKSYEYSMDYITSNSFVYLDPPYLPITETSFTSYTKSNFDKTDHEKLASFYKKISDKGANVLLSNSCPPKGNIYENFYKENYEGFKSIEVPAKRYINSNGKKRGPIDEILIRNYDY